MTHLDPIRRVRKGATLATAVAILSAISSLAGAASVPTVTGRNLHNFILTLEHLKFVNGGWTGDADFTVSACPGPSCFHLSGPVKIVSSHKSEVTDYEGFFAIPGMACVLHLEEVPRHGMDSGDYRLTLVGKDHGRKDCSSLPAEVEGVYRQVDQSRSKADRP